MILHQIHYNFALNSLRFHTKFITILHQIYYDYNFAPIPILCEIVSKFGKVNKLRKRGQRKGRQLRIEEREYTERSKRVGNQRESKEIRQIE